MKPNLSKDGRYRVTIQASHRIGSEAIAAILAMSAERDTEGEYGPLPVLSRAKAEEMARDVLRRKGAEGWQFWGDAFDDYDDVTERAAWAAETVRRLWPRLDDEGLRS